MMGRIWSKRVMPTKVGRREIYDERRFDAGLLH